MENTEPRKKRKYTKRAKTLMRSDNDYIDHEYWPKMYAQAKRREKQMRKKYPERYAITKPAQSTIELGPTKTRKISKEEIYLMELKTCPIIGVRCLKHNMFHTPQEPPKNLQVKY